MCTSGLLVQFHIHCPGEQVKYSFGMSNPQQVGRSGLWDSGVIINYGGDGSYGGDGPETAVKDE